MATHEPGYLALHRTGELARRAEEAWELLRCCTVCPQNCPEPHCWQNRRLPFRDRGDRRLVECASPRGAAYQRYTRRWHDLLRRLSGALHLLPELLAQPDGAWLARQL